MSVLSSRWDDRDVYDTWTLDTTPIPWSTPVLVQVGKRSFVEIV